MADLRVPTLQDVYRAREIVEQYIPRTPTFGYPALNQHVGLDLYIKHENHTPLGSFKSRGGVNLVSSLSSEERAQGVIAASTGNHGQSVAFAARVFGVKAIVCVPEGANPSKVSSMEALGAEIVFHGRDFDDARVHAESLGNQHGYRYVHSGDEPDLIAGVGTYTLEMLEDQPAIDTILVPIGGGSGAAGCCVVAKSINPEIQVIGVQAEKAPAAYLSWSEGRHVESTMETFAEGLATRAPFAFPQKIMREMLDDFILVSEDALKSAMMLYLEKTRNLVEGAGAAALAGAIQLKDRLRDRRVAVVLSGSNISMEQLKELMASS